MSQQLLAQHLPGPLLLGQQTGSFLPTALASYFLLLAWASILGWVFVARHYVLRGQMLPMEQRDAAPWGILEVGLLVCGWFLSQVVGLVVAGLLGGFTIGENIGLSRLIGSQGALLIAVPAAVHWGAMLLMLCWLRRFASWTDLGLSRKNVLNDIALGGAAFVLIVPPVLVIQNILVAAFPAEAEHPFIEVLRSKSDPSLIAAICFAAVASAPVLEEFMYRVVIQGWLERALMGARSGGCESQGNTESQGDTESDGNTGDGPLKATEEALDYNASELGGAGRVVYGERPVSDDPYESPRETRDTGAMTPSLPRPISAAAIVVSSLLFAGVHIGQGTAPISLFFLAIGLGYLYQRTHRVLPCIVVHFLLNAQTMAILLLNVFFGES